MSAIEDNKSSWQTSRGWEHSLWIDTTPDTDYPVLNTGIEVDTLIIGGGIVGITSAIILKEEGQRVALVEMNKIAKGITGHTTAKVTSLHGLRYHKLIDIFSVDQAKTYADANNAALEKIASFVSGYDIDCDFKRTQAYTYTESNENIDTIKKEVEAAQRVGIPAEYIKEAPVQFEIKGAVRVDNQAQFHPRKYILALANIVNSDGSYIFENTKALNIRDEMPCRVETPKGKITAGNVIMATTFPFYDTGNFYSKLYPYYAYAIGMYVRDDVPEGIYFTEDGAEHSIRNHTIDNNTILIVGGGHHKTGQGGITQQHFRNVEEYAKKRFDVDRMKYYWSTEDFSTPDEVPFVGLAPKSKHVYMATGFGGWGMTNGTVSGMLISDLLLGKNNSWRELFDPSRVKIAAFGRKSILEGINIVGQYAKEFLGKTEKESLDELNNNEGAIIGIEGKKIAAYKDEGGKVYKLSSKCTHMGCPVGFNDAEKTWDCTCHGSRFSYDGTVIQGPALENLTAAEVE